MKNYTLIALVTPVGVVAINRRKIPFKGMWNLIGGKVEPDEAILDGAVRETFEESGVRLAARRFTGLGVMNWRVDGKVIGRIYLYRVRIGAELALPRMTREGLLAALDPQWLAGTDNQGVVPDLRAVLPLMMGEEHDLDLTADYAGDDFIELQVNKHD